MRNVKEGAAAVGWDQELCYICCSDRPGPLSSITMETTTDEPEPSRLTCNQYLSAITLCQYERTRLS